MLVKPGDHSAKGFILAEYCRASQYKSSATPAARVVLAVLDVLERLHGTDLRQNWRRSRWECDILGWRSPAAAEDSGYTGWAGDWPAGRPGPVLITHAGR